MTIKELETMGYYEPGFLHLRINTNHEILDLNKFAADPLTAPYFSTFFHEYIHFLQNVTTVSGLMTSVFFIDLIKDMNWEVRNDGKPEFHVPFQITNKNNIEANIKLRGIYTGSRSNIDTILYDGYIAETEAVTDKDGRVVNPEQYKAFYYDPSRATNSFYFGSVCLTEYVAHANQNYFSIRPHPDVPYLAPELIISKEYPEFGNDPMLITALCDATMMTFHPAQTFFNTIKRMKLEKFIPKSAIEVYDFALDKIIFRNKDGEFTPMSLYDYMLDLAVKQYGDALKADIFHPNNAWIKHIFSEAQTLRHNIPDFMTKLVKAPGQLSDLYYTIFRTLGTPFFTNNNMIGGFVPPAGINPAGIQPYQLLVFKEIINIYMGETKCDMYKFCKSRPDKDITNADCLSAPWKRGVEDQLCPFGQFWKTWGLNGEVPVK